MNGLDQLEAQMEAQAPASGPVPNTPTVPAAAAGGLDTLEAACDAHLASDPAHEANEVLQLADETGAPRQTIETFLPELRAERDWFTRRQPADPADITVGPRPPRPDPVGLREQIGRMDAWDWAGRAPFSPAPALKISQVLGAVARLRADRYETEGVPLTPALGQFVVSGTSPRPGANATALQQRARDIEVVEGFLLKQQEVAERGQTFAAAVFDGISYMPAWMIEFALTGGLAKLGSAAAQEIGLRTLQGYAKTTAGRALLKTAGWTGGALTRTTLGMPHRVTEEILSRRIPSITVGPEGELSIGLAPESWATSIAKGWGAAVIETASETAGAGIAGGTRWVTRQTLGKLPFGQALYDGMRRAYLALHPEPGAALQFAEKFFNKVGYDGLLAELTEERLNTILHGIAATRQFSDKEDAGYLENLAAGITQDLTVRNLAVEATVLSVPGAVGLAAQVGMKRRTASPAAATAGTSLGKGPTDGQQMQGPQGPIEPVRDQGGTTVPPGPIAAQPAAAGATGTASGRTIQPKATAELDLIPDDVLAAAEAEAAAQAAERFVGPGEFTFKDYARALEGTSDEDLGRLARRLGTPVKGATGDNLRKWVGDTIATLTREAEPPAALAGEQHPGQMTFQRFMDRYGAALADRENPKQKAWLDRYTKGEGPQGIKGLYRELVGEWRRSNAWRAFYELTGQARPETSGQLAVRSSRQEPPAAASREQQGPTELSEEETRAQIVQAETAETAAALQEFFGVAPAADLPAEATAAAPYAPGPWQLDWARRVWDYLGVHLPREGETVYPVYAEKDFREIYKFLQLPQDIARTFPQFGPVYQVQRAREIANHTLGQTFARMTQPYFDLTDNDRRPVDRLLVAIDQNPGDGTLHANLMAQLSEQQRAAANAIRDGLDRAADLLVEWMQKLGIPEERIEEFRARIGNYIPHKWYGPWAVVAKEKGTGRTVFMSAVGTADRQQEAQRLAGLFPGAKIAIVKRTRLPDSAYQDAPLAAVTRMVELVIEQAQARAEGRPDLPADAREQLKGALTDLYKARGFGQHFIQRSETPGWTEDLRRPLAQYFAGFAGFLSKMEAGIKFAEALEAIDPQQTPNLYKYATEYIRYVMGETREFARFKAAAYYWYIFGRVSSAATNATGNLVMGWPVLSKHTNWPLAKLLTAGARTAAGRLTGAEEQFLQELETAGYLDPTMSQEISARGGNAMYRFLQGAWGQGLSWVDWFRYVERWNRRTMAVALHEAGITDVTQAGELVEEAHFHYAKGNRPTLMRGYMAAPAVFRSYLINQLTWIKNEIKAGRLAPVARQMAATALVGGGRALPFAGLGIAIYARIFGSNPEEDAAAYLGDTLADVVFRGVPGAAGVSMTGSVNMEIVPTFEPGQEWYKTWAEFALGVPADLPARYLRIQADLVNGRYGRALEDFAPEALKNPLAAWRLYSEGATARGGRTILDLERGEQLKLSGLEAGLKALGFTPDRLRREYDRNQLFALVQAHQLQLKQGWADRLYLAAQDGDTEAWQEVVQERAAHERRMQARGQPWLVIPEQDLVRMLKTRARPVNEPTARELPLIWKIWGKEPAAPAQK